MKENQKLANWDSYKRKSKIISKSVYNEMLNQELKIHYNYLHNRLVKKEEYEAIFNDTYLLLTRKYNPKEDLIEQFIKIFKQLRFAYQKDDTNIILKNFNNETINCKFPCL